MLRVERSGARVIFVSRLARARAVAVLAGALAVAAVASASLAPALCVALLGAAALVALLGGRAVRARFERERVQVRPAIPFRRADDRPLDEFAGARVETVGEARRRRAARLERQYRDRSGGEMPSWMQARDVPGTNDHLRRIVLVASRGGEPLPVTAWLAEDDLEPARAEIEGMLRT